MQADRRDRSDNAGENARSRHGTQALLMVVVAVILAGGALLMLPGETPDEAAEVPPPAVAAKPPQPDPAENIRQAPDIPEPEKEPEPEPIAAADPAPEPAREPEPEPPTTEEIDERLRESLNDAGADDSGILASALAAPFMLDRGVSAIDQVARGYVPLRALNLPRPAGTYTVTREGQQRFVDESTYDRYDQLVDGLTAMNPAQLAAAFQRHRGLLAEAYAALGYPADAMDNAVIAALDAVLATPVIRRPLALKTKGALYAYVDPDLESRSDLQKQLLRMGPDNLEALQRWAQELRSALLR